MQMVAFGVVIITSSDKCLCALPTPWCITNTSWSITNTVVHYHHIVVHYTVIFCEMIMKICSLFEYVTLSGEGQAALHREVHV